MPLGSSVLDTESILIGLDVHNENNIHERNQKRGQ